MARSHSGSVYSNPLLNAHGGDDGGSVCSHGTRDEDILAAEVTNLRMKTRDLESQASAASDSARLAGTFEKENVSLRKENAKLKSMVTASMSEASEAKVEVAKLTSEANVLHAQLAEVISAINSRAHKDIVLQQKQQNHFHDKLTLLSTVYNEFIQDRHHVHMNATKWLSLTQFVKYLGREGKCKVDETPKGWFIKLTQEDPFEAMERKKRREREKSEKEADESI
eukprot:jgi/Picre1/29250/NNA_004642.t1